MKKEQTNLLEAFLKNENNLTWVQRMVLKRTQEKMFKSPDFQDYEDSDNYEYNDCHSDYFDANYN